MRRRGLSAKLDRHMERGEELMELNRDALDFNREALDLNREEIARSRATAERNRRIYEQREDDLKVFIREMNLRSEKNMEALFREGREFMAEQRKRTDEIVAEMRDGREERRAQTQALLALIDRLPPAQAA